MRGRTVLLAVGVVALVVVLAAAAEIAACRVTEGRIAESLHQSLGTSGQTAVTISQHRPFLLQVAGGRLDDITVTADQLSVAGTDVTDIDMHATGLTVRAPYTADDVSVTGVVPISTVRQLLAARGLPADVVAVGQELRATGTLLSVPWDLMLTPEATGGKLAVAVVTADVGGTKVQVNELPAPLRQVFSSLDVPMTGLPQGLAVTGAQVVGGTVGGSSSGGVQVTLAGQDVVLPDS
ncbi:MAG: DUF2993 domain-containing protein [Micrococcales bacterium]|nr:DUF2993 domain-containing protein [Micrococcales bacterium]